MDLSILGVEVDQVEPAVRRPRPVVPEVPEQAPNRSARTEPLRHQLAQIDLVLADPECAAGPAACPVAACQERGADGAAIAGGWLDELCRDAVDVLLEGVQPYSTRTC